MRTAITAVATGSVLVTAPVLTNLPPAAAAATLAVSIPLTGLCSDGFTPLAVASGALGALAFQGLAPLSLPVASALLVAFAYAPRTLRARTSTLRSAHALATLGAGALGALIASYARVGAPSDLAVRCAAVLVAGIVTLAPRLITVDDLLAHGLLNAAQDTNEPARSVLLRAVFLRRRVNENPPEGLSARALERLERAWRVLLDAAEARAQGARAHTAALVDARIDAHVTALERIYAAADERLARSAGLDDGALREAAQVGETLEAEVSALAELAQVPLGPRAIAAPTAIAPSATSATSAPVAQDTAREPALSPPATPAVAAN